MPNYLDNIDVIDSNGTVTNALLQDRGTLALANQNASNLASEITNRTNADTNLQNKIGNLSELDTSIKTSLVEAINEVYAKPSFVATPEEYGAIGDGITDDTVALQNCLNNCKIAILNGVYFITSSINIPKGVIIVGTGTIKANSIFDYLVLNGDNEINGITFTDTNNYDGSSGDCIYAIDKENITILNCTFNTIGAGCCILLEHCNHIVIENNKLTDYGFAGIMLKSTCRYASIQFNKLYNSRYMGGQHSYPICFSAYQLTEDGPAEYVKVNYNEIIEVSPHWEGIDSHGAKDYEVIGNRIIGTLSGMNLGSTPTSIDVNYEYANHNCIIKDNYIECGSTDSTEVPYGIQLSEQPNCRAQNAIIENNYIKVNSSNEATTAICSAIAIRGNGGSRNCIINNNIFEVTNRHCIGIDYGKHENLVIKNNYAKSMTTTNNWYYFFTMSLVNDYDNIEVINNRLRNAFSGNIGFFYGSTTAPTDNKLIEFKGNDDKGLTSSRINYSTLPDSTLLAITKAKGIAGQFKPSTSATVAGWLCHGANNWVEIAGTSA